MGDPEQLNWVEKRHKADEHLANAKHQLWKDLCAALTDASRSFNQLYNGKSDALPIKDRRFRVDLRAGDQIDVDFDDHAGAINVSYISHPPRFRVRNFKIAADHVTAFFTDENDARLTTDEVSEGILTPSFFPESEAPQN